MVPIAANSLTSPAPVAPIRCPGSISMSPTAKPASDPATVTPLVCDAANETPRAAMPRVSVFGTRRLQTSTTALAPPLAATAATTATSEILGNALPEHRVDGVPNLGHRGERDDRDQSREQAVLEQILPVLTANVPGEQDKNAVHMPILGKTRRGQLPRPCR